MTPTTTTISNLPAELVEEIISRIPLTSMRAVRLTCRKWDTLSKSGSFTKLHMGKITAAAAAAREKGESPPVILLTDQQLYLMSVTPTSEIDADPSTEPKGEHFTCCLKDDSDQQVKIHQIYYCEGLLLCILKDDDRIVVWNPYWGQTRWIKLRFYFRRPMDRLDWCRYALGYSETERKKKSYKILRFLDFDIQQWACGNGDRTGGEIFWYEIYDLDSGEWKTIDVGTPHWRLSFESLGVSLKGNTYWRASLRRNTWNDGLAHHLICFDYTRNRFGPLLPLPFEPLECEIVTLSCVGEEKLAVLYQKDDPPSTTEVWITQTIEAEKVSWIKLLTLDAVPFEFSFSFGSFLVDEEKKAALVFDVHRHAKRCIVYGIGEAGYFRKLHLHEYTKTVLEFDFRACSYVPSLAQIKQPRGGQREQESTSETVLATQKTLSLDAFVERLKAQRLKI
ncbi:unnamed protein product [Microthlaspi erraticum]|uniref:F-box domain-containing protein n=1 Tax=Microthlaspi erraticum TaxID=1685480 RepID=A0A6D2K1U6_9BRAS|nr:unnamed protein product [Microthlaspi erraticum]